MRTTARTSALAVIILLVAMVMVGGCSVPLPGSSDASGKGDDSGNTAPSVSAALPGTQSVAGRILVVKDASVWMLKGNQFKRIANGVRFSCPVWSPDGQQFAVIEAGDNHSDLFVFGGEGAQLRQLTKNWSNKSIQDCAWARSPVWSPSGKSIAYVTDTTGAYTALSVIDAKGGSPRSLSAGFGASVDYPSWSPDGNTIAITGFGNGGSQIYAVDVESGEFTKLTDAKDGALQPAWSPDGSKIAYVVRNGNDCDLWVMNADGTNQVKITNEGLVGGPTWSPDGKMIAYLAGRPSSDLYVIDFPNVPQDGKGRALTNGSKLDTPSRLSWTE